MSMKIRVTDGVDEEVEQEKRKISELFREIKSKGDHEDSKLNWMYRNPTEVVDREEYLLGRSVDKALDMITGKNQASNSELANFPKRVLTIESRRETGQVDVHKKLHEDPLMAIRQREMDARKQLLNNPLKVKELKKMLEAEAKKNKKAEKAKRKEERRKRREDKINLSLVNALRQFSGKLDIKSLLNSSSDSSSELDNKGSFRKRLKKKKKVTESSSDETDIEEDSSKEKLHNKGTSRKRLKKIKEVTESSSEETDLEEDNKGTSSIRLKKKKKVTESSSEETNLEEDNKGTSRKRLKKKKKVTESSSEETDVEEDPPIKKRSGRSFDLDVTQKLKEKYSREESSRNRSYVKSRKETDERSQKRVSENHKSRKLSNRSKKLVSESLKIKGKNKEPPSSCSETDTSNEDQKRKLMNKDKYAKRKQPPRSSSSSSSSSQSEENESSSNDSSKGKKGRYTKKSKMEKPTQRAKYSNDRLEKTHKSFSEQIDKQKHSSHIRKGEASGATEHKRHYHEQPNSSIGSIRYDIGSSRDAQHSSKVDKDNRSVNRNKEQHFKATEDAKERSHRRSRDKKHPSNSDGGEYSKGAKKFGLSTLDGSKPDTTEKQITPYKKKEEIKSATTIKRNIQLTEEEREKELRGMVDNAKWRKKEREADFLKYKKDKQREEKIDDYDDSFVKSQLSKFTGHGSMADRIKSNLNKLQRSDSSMDKSFVRK